MRSKSALILLLIVAMTVMPMSVIGQEEPLPVVTARTGPLIDTFVPAPMVFLAAEPIREEHPPTLLEAARANDYATFDALFRDLKARGESLGTFETLHELWTYSVTDPIGAFYGAELYERLHRAYPGYAAYIADFRIIDDRGNAFYPTSETRAFLLDRALEGRAAPRVQVASDEPIVPRPQRVTPEAVSAPPVTLAAEPATTSVTTPAAVPVATAPPAQVLPSRSSRGILLVFAGLVGVGLLALILRTPGEQPPMTILPTAGAAANNVEPLRKQEPPAGTGTHG